MPRTPQWPPPVYQRDGKDIVRLHVGPGRYRDVTLGPAGSPESRAEYARILAEIQANGGRMPPDQADLTVLELVAAYFDHAERRYDGRQLARLRTALRAVVALYGHTRADAFGPLALKVVRAEHAKKGYCRSHVNQLMHCVRRAFRWAAAEEMIPPSVVVALAQVEGLRRNDPSAPPDREKVRPVAPGLVEATLPHLAPVVAAMVRLQLLTGMRPGEVCVLRPADVNRGWMTVDGKTVWLYKLDHHKGEWRGGERLVPIGPRAQEVLAPFLARDPSAYCFSPAEATAAFRRRRRAARKSKVQPSQADRSKPSPRKKPGGRYTTQSYGRAIQYACDRAILPRWSPNQLRHLAATLVEVEGGREDARCFLGHAEPSVTARYAESAQRAARVAAKIG